jgi:hypothetical protein
LGAGSVFFRQTGISKRNGENNRFPLISAVNGQTL